jgi:thiamine-monophosphate kinase
MVAESPTLRTLGEFGLLKRLRRTAPPSPPEVLLGIGDDACILRLPPGFALVATVDTLVEGEDFRWEWTPPEAVGYKGLAVNLSDLGSMGAIPRYALVALSLPATTPVAVVDRLYQGLWRAAEGAGVTVVGGDLSEAPRLVFSLTLLGEGEPEKLLRRSMARVGDRIWVTGPLGKAAAGLRALQAGYRVDGSGVRGGRGKKIPVKIRKALRETIQAQLYPEARYREGRILAQAGVATAMIDLSDGFASDLTRLAEESRVGARIFVTSLPLDPSTVRVATTLGLDPVKLALAGGEDFELLFTSGKDLAVVQNLLTGHGFRAPHQVGEIVSPEEGLVVITPDGKARPLQGGFQHFR